jgi:hypothetical protein
LHPVEALGLSGKAFVAIDGDSVSGSFWGEADWQVTPAIAVRAGGIVGYSG